MRIIMPYDPDGRLLRTIQLFEIGLNTLRNTPVSLYTRRAAQCHAYQVRCLHPDTDVPG